MGFEVHLLFQALVVEVCPVGLSIEPSRHQKSHAGVMGYSDQVRDPSWRSRSIILNRSLGKLREHLPAGAQELIKLLNNYFSKVNRDLHLKLRRLSFKKRKESEVLLSLPSESSW